MYDELGAPGAPMADINGMGMNYVEMNKGVTPVFFLEPVQDFGASEREGRPIFVERERVRIIVAGDMLTAAVSPVTPEIKDRFSEAYARWQTNRTERHIDGTPLAQWPLVTPVQIKEFEALNIFSIEGLASVSDGNIARLPDGRAWRERAKAWLAQAKDGAVAAKYAAENERLRSEQDEMKRQIADLAARLDDQPRRGRPPKSDAA